MAQPQKKPKNDKELAFLRQFHYKVGIFMLQFSRLKMANLAFINCSLLKKGKARICKIVLSWLEFDK